MRRDGEVPDARMIRQDDRHRGRARALPPAGLEDVAIEPAPRALRSSARATAAVEFLRAVVVEQGLQAQEMRPQRVAAGRQALEERRR